METLGFAFLFFFFLMLNVTSDKIFIYSNCCYKIATRPKRIAPAWFLFQPFARFEQMYGTSPLDDANNFRNGALWWNANQHMNMVWLNTHLLYLNIIPLINLTNPVSYDIFHFAFQNPVTILGHKDNMELQ